MNAKTSKVRIEDHVVVIEKGHSYSIVVHPEDHERIVSLPDDGRELTFTEETGRKWSVRHLPGYLLFTHGNKEALVEWDSFTAATFTKEHDEERLEADDARNFETPHIEACRKAKEEGKAEGPCPCCGEVMDYGPLPDREIVCCDCVYNSHFDLLEDLEQGECLTLLSDINRDYAKLSVSYFGNPPVAGTKVDWDVLERTIARWWSEVEAVMVDEDTVRIEVEGGRRTYTISTK